MGYYRHPRTTQERRESEEGWGRTCRNLHNLSNAWDDIGRSPYTRKNWKYYRLHQYKVKSDKPKKDSTAYGLSMSVRNHFHKEHRYCYSKRRRCKWCWKNDIWDDPIVYRKAG